MPSLRTKFLFALLLVALLGVGTVALVANRVTQHEFTLYVGYGGQVRAHRLAQDAADYYAQTGSWAGIEPLLVDQDLDSGPGQGFGPGRGRGTQAADHTTHSRILIIDPQSRVVVDTAQELVGQPIEMEDEQNGTPIMVDGQQVGTLLITTPDLSGQSTLEQQFLNTVNRAVWIAVLLVAAASFVAAILLSRQLVGPLRQLTTAAETMAKGDLSQRVQVHSQDEIGELGSAFNKMAGDLQAAERQRRQMTADIAHELRNPLSVIRGNLEALLDGIYPADSEHLAPIYEETLLLQRLVQDLRTLSLADAGRLELICTPLDLNRLLTGIADSAQAVAQDQDITLQVEEAPAPLIVDGDADRLRQVIGNLVSNALRYTPAGGAITLHTYRADNQAHFAVTDTGPGIPPHDLPHIFDRFYQGDAARQRSSGGSGLGLAIARALSQAHGGAIDVQSAPDQGTTFTVHLPITQ